MVGQKEQTSRTKLAFLVSFFPPVPWEKKKRVHCRTKNSSIHHSIPFPSQLGKKFLPGIEEENVCRVLWFPPVSPGCPVVLSFSCSLLSSCLPMGGGLCGLAYRNFRKVGVCLSGSCYFSHPLRHWREVVFFLNKTNIWNNL